MREVIYGRRKMRTWLQRNGFPDTSKRTVERLMRWAGMKGLVRGRRTTTTIRSKDRIRAKDLLNRNFDTDSPNKVWITGFTHVPIWGGFAHVPFVIDLLSRKILSCASSTSHYTSFVEEAFELVLWQRRNERKPHVKLVFGTIHHTDADSEYTSQWYTQTLAMEGLLPSIVRFAIRQHCRRNSHGFVQKRGCGLAFSIPIGALVTKSDVVDVVIRWVHWYNFDRLNSAPGYCTPKEFDELYYDEMSGSLIDEAARILAA